MSDLLFRYLKLGWFIFPIHAALPGGHCTCGRKPCPDKPGKHPRTENGQKDASNDPAQIAAWLKRWPTSNWAVHCALSKFCAVDIDPRDGGDKTFAALVEKCGALPLGPVQNTGGGGWHYLLQPPTERQLRGTLGRDSGIQIKHNGYIVIEPSNHESGLTYSWGDTLALTIPEIPPQWIDSLCRPITQPTAHNPAYHNAENELESAVYAIPADEYETWVQVGMAIKSAVGESGFGLWDSWSKQSEKYDGRGMDRKWASFAAEGGITAATVYGLARAAGWRPVTRLHSVPSCPLQPDVPLPDDEDIPDDLRDDICNEVISLGPREPEPEPGKVVPVIYINPNMEDIINAAEDAILSMPRRNLYQRAGHLVRVTRDAQPPSGITRPAGAMAIKICPAAHLHELCSRAATWLRFDKRAKTKECDGWLPALPPAWVVASLDARGQWRFPPIVSITAAPTLRPDGSILDKPGYDERTGLLYLPGGIVFPHIPTSPTREDAHDALCALAEPFCDFPFTSRCDLSAAIAAVLSIVCRSAISGPVPLFAVRATTAGTGKSLLADIVAIIGTGRPAPRWAQSGTEEEERKRLLALALEGDPVLVLDNITHALGSGALDMAVTAGAIKDRVLGSTESAEAPWRAVVIATGNNLQVKGDMTRRIQPIDLDACMEKPEERSGWKHKDIISWTLQERPRLVQAALIAVRAYAVAEWPDVGATPMGSFEGYCRVVRNTIIWAGFADPAESRERIRQDGDPELEALRTILHAWDNYYGSGEMVLADVAQELDDPVGDHARALKTALEDATKGRKGSLASRVGYYLRQYRGRIVDGLRIVSGDKVNTGVPWYIQHMER